MPHAGGRLAGGNGVGLSDTIGRDLLRSVLGDGGDDGVGQGSESSRRNWKYRRRGSGSRPYDFEPPQVRIHDHAQRPGVADWRDPTDAEAGQLMGFARSRPANLRLGRHRCQTAQIHTVRSGDQADDWLESAVLARRHEYHGLDDLAEVRANRRSSLMCRVGRLIEESNPELDALASGCLQHPFDGGLKRELGHGPSLAWATLRSAARRPPHAARLTVEDEPATSERYDRPMQAILFDWDGTLVDSLGTLYDANAAVMQAFGVPFDPDLYRTHYAPDWRLMYRRLGIAAERLDEANELWLASYDRGAGAIMFAGVKPALRRLKRAGHRLGLVTAGDRDIVLPQLERFGLANLLEVRVFGDDLPVHKPDPAPLSRALADVGLAASPAQAAYVGDAPDDMRMARTVGTHAVGIASSLGDPAALRAAGALEVAASVPEWVAGYLADSSAA